MQIFNKPDETLAKLERGVGLGFFDGVHRGHLELIRTLVFRCGQQKLLPAIFTFPSHPETVLFPDDPFTSYLSTLEERMERLAENGIEETHLQPFDEDFAKIEPQDFLDRFLGERLQARLIVVGQDYRFGFKGQGDVAFLQKWAEERGIEVIVIQEVCLLGEKVSSSRIRDAIGEGDLSLAESLLGRTYRISGVVMAGRGLGRQMGFPTANIMMPSDLACPAYGVYATRTRIGDRVYDSVTNIGLRPTVDQKMQQPLIETFLFDAELSLYNQTVQVEFLQKIRPERQFGSLLQLGAQVREDLQTVRQWHLTAEKCFEKARISGIPLYLLPTQRFAQSALYLIFYSPLEPRRATCQNLLLRVLTASCRRYPSRTSLAAAMDNLYGSSIEANFEKQGDLQIMNLSAEGLMSWTDGSSPFRDTCSLLFDLLFEPLLDDDGLFDETTVEAERQNLILEQAARENDRSKYAYDHCLSLFCGDQVQGHFPGRRSPDAP